MNFTSYLAQYRILCILAELSEGRKSAVQLAAAIGIDRSGVPAYLKHIGARVAGWDGLTPLYDMRRAPNVPRPPKVTKADKWRRLKADPARHARVKALQRIRNRRLRDGWTGGLVIVIDGNVNRA